MASFPDREATLNVLVGLRAHGRQQDDLSPVALDDDQSRRLEVAHRDHVLAVDPEPAAPGQDFVDAGRPPGAHLVARLDAAVVRHPPGLNGKEALGFGIGHDSQQLVGTIAVEVERERTGCHLGQLGGPGLVGNGYADNWIHGGCRHGERPRQERCRDEGEDGPVTGALHGLSRARRGWVRGWSDPRGPRHRPGRYRGTRLGPRGGGSSRCASWAGRAPGGRRPA